MCARTPRRSTLPTHPPLGQQQRCNQEPTDDKKHFNAEETARNPRQIGVEQQHGNNGKRTQSIKGGQINEPWAARMRRIVPVGGSDVDVFLHCASSNVGLGTLVFYITPVVQLLF
ncbi:MAG: hypothetical protein HC828_22490 [Blastochloris sp.]|nr:hypothetical protein [Blastochloris sp.]